MLKAFQEDQVQLLNRFCKELDDRQRESHQRETRLWAMVFNFGIVNN